MAIKHLLGFATFLAFIVCFFMSKNKKRTYLLVVWALFMFMELHITNDYYGTVTVFDGISYFMLFYFIKDFTVGLKFSKLYVLLFCALTVVIIVGCLQSSLMRESLINGFKYLSVFIYAKVLIDECFADNNMPDTALKYLKIACISSVIFLVIQLIVGLQFSFYPNLNPNTEATGTIRYPSFFYDAQVYAQFLAMCSFLFLIKTINQTSRQTLFNRLFFFVIIIVLFLTGGRAGFTGLCAGVLLIVLSGPNKFRLFIVAAAVVGYIVITNFPGTFAIFNREESLNDSLDTRTRIWHEAYKVFTTNPLWGIGIGNYMHFSLLHSENGYYILDDEVVYYGTESGYLKILAECGILGLISIFSFVLIPMFTGFIAYFKKRINYNIFYLFAGICSWMVAFITSNTLDDKRIIIFLATLLSLIIALQKNNRSQYVQ